jgi:hypothetical protein
MESGVHQCVFLVVIPGLFMSHPNRKFCLSKPGLEALALASPTSSQSPSPHQALDLAWLGLQSQGFGFWASGF